MINKFIQSLEDPNMPLLGPNFWFLKKLGLILPDNLKGRLFYFAFHGFAALFAVSQYIELYIIRSDLSQVLNNMIISMQSVIICAKIASFFLWQVHWRELIDYINDADIAERNTDDPERQKILAKYTKYCRFVMSNYLVLVCMTCVVTVSTPPIRYWVSPSYRQSVRNGSELFQHMLSSWMPFDKYSSPGCWFTVGWHGFCCAYGAALIVIYDTSVMVIMMFFGGKLELLRERCRLMLGTDGLPIGDDEAFVRIREVHHIHVQIMKYSRSFNSMLSPVMFLYVLICSLMICATSYQLTAETDAASKISLALYLLMSIAQLFNFCWHSSEVFDKFQKVRLGPYESQWWATSARQRRCALLLAKQLDLTHVFSAGPFTDLTLATFVTILKGSCSYYTLVRD